METTRIHPIWKEAALAIVERVTSEGYGFTIELDELYLMLETKKPRALSFWKDAKKSQFDFLEKIEELKRVCLREHNICLFNVRGKGYRVLHPDDQVTEGYERHHGKMRRQLRKGCEVLINVEASLLSEEGRRNRDQNISRSTFILAAANKRKIPAVERKKIA